MYNLCENPNRTWHWREAFCKGEETHMLKGIEIVDLPRDNGLDSHQLSINRPPASDRHPSYDGESTAEFNEAST